MKAALEAINHPSLKLVIAPHEITEKHLSAVQELFPTAVRYSQLTTHNSPLTIQHPSSGILIIDNIGLLSRLYKYATITYIGGGFGKGIHNTLEAAVYGKPVLFGPMHHKFREATELIRNGGAIAISNTGDLATALQQLLADEQEYTQRCNSSLQYIYENRGATDKIIRFIYEKRLLTS